MTFIIDLPPDIAERVRADAQAQGLAEADLLRAFIEKSYTRPRRPIPPPGFAAHLREEREAAGDFRDGGQIIRDLRDAEWQERDERLGIAS